MFELYLDCADITRIAHINSFLPLSGITTNPSILANAGIGINPLLEELVNMLGSEARFFAQIVSEEPEQMFTEALYLNDLPYHLVIKIPATESGLTVIKRLKTRDIPTLATAIYSVQQGFLAALAGADYLAPYVNRISMLGTDGIRVVADLQNLLDRQQIPSKILAASFKSTQQALAVIECGAAAITLPPDIAEHMLSHPAVPPAIAQFSQDWQRVFGDKLSFQS